MKGRGDIFDFTVGETQGVTRDPSVSVKAAAQVLCVQLRPEHLPSSNLSFEIAGCLDDFFDVVARSEPSITPVGDGADRLLAWRLWSETVRLAVGEVFSAYQAFVAGLPDHLPTDVSIGLARVATEVVRWDLIVRQAPDPNAWAVLGQLFLDFVDPTAVEVASAGGGVTSEYIRAIAYHSAALDQFPQMGGVTICRVIDAVLPFIALKKDLIDGALYLVNPPVSAIPVRVSRALASPGWCYHAEVGGEYLAELYGQLVRGSIPHVLGGRDIRLLRDAVAHLRRHWSRRPPVRRFRRHTVDAKLLVVRGYDSVKDLFEAKAEVANGAWRITDLSRGGVGALVYHDEGSIPEAGELLAFRPHDGVSWHLGLVRRVRQSSEATEVGIESLSIRPELVRADDGLVAVDLLFCDPVLRGEAVRVVAPVNVLRQGAPLFVNAEGRMSKLKPLEGVMYGKGYELRVYQVL
ncbi:hypothetical protein J5J83_10620 [Azoarcus sp. L1K30]|uniref:hypothetical protein n=1 Tax=Azoarcus sp. L1K30 TaxID=2820277 RepID=UPI001B81E8F8|nr:hypothetical protein [Azoarcus sp. L1K30]MBR0566567.1 hypothetical protein [Azoarcus sp. L1K30]